MLRTEVMLALVSASLNKNGIVIETIDNPFKTTEHEFKDYNIIIDRTTVCVWNVEKALVIDTQDIENIKAKETVKSLSKLLVETKYPQEELFNEKVKELEKDVVDKQIEHIKKYIAFELADKPSKLTIDNVYVMACKNILGEDKITVKLSVGVLGDLADECRRTVINSIGLPY